MSIGMLEFGLILACLASILVYLCNRLAREWRAQSEASVGDLSQPKVKAEQFFVPPRSSSFGTRNANHKVPRFAETRSFGARPSKSQLAESPRS